MMKTLVLIIIALLLTSCAPTPSVQAIQTAIVQTQVSLPIETLAPTYWNNFTPLYENYIASLYTYIEHLEKVRKDPSLLKDFEWDSKREVLAENLVIWAEAIAAMPSAPAGYDNIDKAKARIVKNTMDFLAYTYIRAGYPDNDGLDIFASGPAEDLNETLNLINSALASLPK